MIKWIISKLKKPKIHKHRFKTTHTNKWMHPTRQECDCGVSREFELFENHKEMNCMPWDKGRWVHSDGEESKYSTYSRY